MKKILILVLFFALFTASIYSEEDDWNLSILVGVNHVFEYNLRPDYPVVPSHTPPCLGAAISYFFTDKWELELNGWFTNRAKVTIYSAGGGDSVKYRTADHLSLVLSLLYHFEDEKKFRPYILGGAGIDFIIVGDEVYPSELDDRVLFRTYRPDTMINFGAGFKYYFKPTRGAIFDVRYSLIFDNVDTSIGSLVVRAGIFFLL